MRDWNDSEWRLPLLVPLSYLTYERLKPNLTASHYFTSNLSYLTYERLKRHKKNQKQWVGWSSYLTYERLKQSGQSVFQSQPAVVPYLWEIETQSTLEAKSLSFARHTLPMRDWNKQHVVNVIVSDFGIIVVPYLWEIETFRVHVEVSTSRKSYLTYERLKLLQQEYHL